MCQNNPESLNLTKSRGGQKEKLYALLWSWFMGAFKRWLTCNNKAYTNSLLSNLTYVLSIIAVQYKLSIIAAPPLALM